MANWCEIYTPVKVVKNILNLVNYKDSNYSLLQTSKIANNFKAYNIKKIIHIFNLIIIT
ncbi:hypothetical protein [Spiroplasma endosymbiont of Diplazon laetatorius]|uniref:hypothetical protein n=1 Tax=Spiroplasma endosymbiont of Diplazon laetatorius TaxID=3066322 RepID=UPI0030CFDC24